MKKLISTIIFGLLLSQVGHAANDLCPMLKADQSQVQAELTLSGIQKLAVWGAGLSLNKLTSDPKSVPISDDTVSPVMNDCTSAKMAAYNSSDLWSNCYGLPKGWVDGTQADLKQWLTPVPSSFGFSQSKLNQISLGNMTIDQCSVSSCNFTLPLKSLEMTTNLAIKPNTSGSSFSVKGLDASITSNTESPILIKGVVKMDSKGRLDQLIQVDPSSVQFKLPVGAAHVDLAHSPADDERLKRLMRIDVYIALQKKFKLPATTKDDQMQSIVANLPPNITSTADFREAMAAAYIQEITPHFNNQRSAELFQSGQWVLSNLTKNPAFTVVLNRMLNSTVIPKITKVINDELKTVPLIGADYPESIPLSRPQNTIDLNLVTQKVALQRTSVSQAMTQVQSSADFNKTSATLTAETDRTQHFLKTLNNMTNSTGVADLLNPLIQDWSGLKSKINDRIMKGSLSDDQVMALQKMSAQCDTNISLLNQELAAMAKIINPNEDFLLRLTSEQADDVNQVIRAGISICTNCAASAQAAPAVPGVGTFKRTKDYDAAVKVSLNTVNAYLASMYNKDSWDMCVAGKKSSDSDCDKFHFFGGPPSVRFNGHGLALNIPKISYNGLVTACGPIDIEVGNSSDGSNITIDPANMHMKFCRDNTSVWKSILSFVETVTVLVPVVENTALKALKSKILNQLGTPQMSLPTEFKVQQVATDADGITAYGSLNLNGNLSDPASGTNTTP